VFKGSAFRGSLLRPSGCAGQAGFSPAAGKKKAGLIEKDTSFPLWGIVGHNPQLLL